MRWLVALVAVVAGVHFGVWALFDGRVQAPNFYGQLASVSYTPYRGAANPDSRTREPSVKDIESDLALLSHHTRAIRTYSSTGGTELVPAVAAEYGLKVTVGAWIDKDAKRNEREIASAISLARRYSNVNGIVVGNETIFRGDQTVADLVKLIRRVKRSSNVPVTTGEIWHVWIEHPELVSAVDFIAAHILPYWEGMSAEATVNHALSIYEQLRQAYPGKRIVIAEFGWPSAGYNRQAAFPGRFEQAQVLREFVTRADQLGIEYNLIEAFDQTWKTFEGSVGTYWGLFDAARHPKFAWVGPITDPDHWKLAGIAVLLGVLLSLPILGISGVTLVQAGLLSVAANAVGAWFTAVFAYWQGHYFVWGAGFSLGLGTLLLVPLVLIALARIQEIAAVAFGRKPLRLIAAPSLALTETAPKVSIHVPAFMEPPDMLKQTLDAVAKLDYPSFECVVVINNTPDPAYWRSIEDHCQALGERFKFVNADKLAGYKAGALRLAQSHTARDAEIIGVIDADYVVQPAWLKDLVPHFGDPKIGLVQAPQDHRDGERSLMHHAMNGEYAGFFDIGMVQRNEANAIVVHGTMCLIRRSALEAAGGWSSDTICEDTDLGLSILEHGYQALYTDRRYGHGLLPDTFEAYKKQRHRWAYGGMQIIKKHWRHFLPGAHTLTRDQRGEFLMGWFNWLGAETIGVAVAILNLIWVPVVAFAGIAVPDKILTLPIIAAFIVSSVHFAMLYRLRVAMPAGQRLTAMFAAMSVQWTVARAVTIGLVKDHFPFMRTAKGGMTRKGPQFAAFWEAVLGVALIAGAYVLFATNYERVREINLFALVLVVQSLPFLSAAAIALIDGSTANDFAFWRNLEARLVALIPRRLAKAPTAIENRVEPAQ
jgi:exo-beta-1,3-glucanase (GH17 family)/cellulose synthase/poly-beta-1,6-N-acetylglucosamine synthase-like glycosyltransferase